MYAPGSVKRQKTTTTRSEAARSETAEPPGRIEYKPEAPYNTDDNFFYRYYNASERIHGRTMEDWLRPSIFLGHGFVPNPKPGCDNNQAVENHKRGIKAMFEMAIKLGLKFWSAYDRNIAPEGETFEETQSNFEQIVELLNEYQQKTGIRPLWIGIDFKYCNRYKNGAATNSDANIVTCAGYQTKRALDMAQRLNAENFLFSGEQESYQNIITSDLKKEMKHYAKFLKMIIDYRDKIRYRGQLLMQTENKKRNAKYNTDLCSTLAFLKHCNYDRYFKANVNTAHDFYMANSYGILGGVDVKKRDLSDTTSNTLLLRTIIENGGISPGGFTYYLPDENTMCETRDLIEGFICAIDTFAKSLRFAVKLINDAQVNRSIQLKYASFSSGWGAKFSGTEANLEECEEYAKKLLEGKNNSMQDVFDRSEHWSSVLHRFLDSPLK